MMGKKSVRWDRDPDIMFRLTEVAQLMIRGSTLPQIAQELEISIRTASRDVRRVKILWRRQAVREIEELRQSHRARLDWMFQQALEQFVDGKLKEEPAPRGLQAWLRLAADIEGEIVNLDGAARPTKVALTDPEGKQEYAGRSDRQRLAEVVALFDIARARQAAKESESGDRPTSSDVSGVDTTSEMDTG